ncbi:MAG: hypothetical protein ACRDPX_01620 [Gaiellaceae bacterium]
MKARRTGFTAVAAALTLAALVAVIGAAQAAPQQKKFSGTVRVTGGAVTSSSATLKLTLTNRTRSQTLGSADFIPPALGVTLGSVVGGANRTGWSAAIEGGVVAFRSTSNALPNGESVSADVSVTISQAACTTAAWSMQAKQSNDFSGSGNDFQFDAQSSDVIPLGSFVIAPIQTIQDGQTIPAIVTEIGHPTSTTALDVCQDTKTNYSGAVRTATFLTEAGYAPNEGLSWTNGIGTLTITPEWTETGNALTVSDIPSGISATSNFFDTTDKLCTPSVTLCEWEDEDKNIKANSSPPPPGANLGIGFNSLLPFDCAGEDDPIGGSIVNINPRGFTQPYVISLTYQKSATGNGSPSSFDVCLSKEDGAADWDAPLSACGSPAVPPCIQDRKRVNGGDLLVVLFLSPTDPWGGIS